MPPRPGVPARFEEVPRSWLMVDLESVPCPPGIDPTDPLLVGGALRRQLPAPFRVGAVRRAVVSSGAGLKPGLRAHLWFLLDRPLVRAELVRWLERRAGRRPAVFVAVQPHYCANPVFHGRRRSLLRAPGAPARLRRGRGAGPAGAGRTRATFAASRHGRLRARRAPSPTPPPACAASRSRPRAGAIRPASPSPAGCSRSPRPACSTRSASPRRSRA